MYPAAGSWSIVCIARELVVCDNRPTGTVRPGNAGGGSFDAVRLDRGYALRRARNAELPSPTGTRRHCGVDARPQHAVLVLCIVCGGARQARFPGKARSRRHRSRAQRDRDSVGRGQQRLDAADPAHGLVRHRPRRPRVSRLVHGQLQSPVLGRHHRASAPPQPAHSDAEILPQAATHLRAGHRARLVGAGFPVHAPPLRFLRQGAPGEAVRGSRRDAPCLPEVRARPDQRDELSRRHAFHARKAPFAALAVSSPAQAEGGGVGACAGGPRREVQCLARRYDRLSGRRADLLAVPVRQRSGDHRARPPIADPGRTARPATT